MAKCGHIFCLPCLIRYMHSSDDTTPIPEKKARWKKCPICWDSIYVSETRPVRWFIGQEGERPQEGADVVLRLIMRQPGSTLALPRDGAESLDKTEDIPWYFAAEVMDYARVMKGSEEYMTDQYDEEVQALQQQEKEDELMFGEETQWTKKAVSSILEAREKIKGIGNPPTAPKQPSERKPRRPVLNFVESGDSVDGSDFYSIQHATKSGQSLSRSFIGPTSWPNSSLDPSPATTSTSQSNESVSPAAQSTDSQSSATSLSQPPASSIDRASPLRFRDRSGATSHRPHNDSPFFFYEALMHYYLSPLDIRILKTAFGNYSSFPATILPRVERVSTGHIIDDELRRRAKYLAHLPHGCEVGFLECNWTDVVSPDVLKGFAVEIERRRRKNQEKESREEKERIRAEKEEDEKRWAAARRRRPNPSHDIISDSDFQPLPEASSVDLALASSSPPWSSSRGQGGSGFASLASPSTSPAASKTVWGTRMIEPTSPDMPAVPDEDEPPENDGWLQDWERDFLDEENLVAQIEASSLEPGNSNHATPAGSNKKKKGKKITLMSTNVRRGA